MEENYHEGVPALPSGERESHVYDEVTTEMIKFMQQSNTSYELEITDDGRYRVTAVSSGPREEIQEVDDLLSEGSESVEQDGLPELDRID